MSPTPTQTATTTVIDESSTTTTDNQIPQYDTIIIECDGSYKRFKDIAAIGYILKKRDGTQIEEHHTETKPATTSTETEAHACLQALKAAQKYNPSFIILYSDCQPVINKITNGKTKGAKDVYLQIFNELQYIRHVSVNHIPRESNTDAHDLAHKTLDELEDNR
jgi:ribonuclease HI